MDRSSSTAPDATSRPLELPIALDRAAAVPLRRQLAEHLRAAIRAGRLPAGAALPSTRDLAEQLGVSRGTVPRRLRARSPPRGTSSCATAPGRWSAACARSPPAAFRPASRPIPRYDLVAGAPDLVAVPAQRLAAGGAPPRWPPSPTRASATTATPAAAWPCARALAPYLARVRGVASAPDQPPGHARLQARRSTWCAAFWRAAARAHVAVEDPSYDGPLGRDPQQRPRPWSPSPSTATASTSASSRAGRSTRSSSRPPTSSRPA